METLTLHHIVELYRSHPCLWDSTSGEHANRDMRQAAMESILTEAGIPITENNLTTLKRKITSLRTTYSRELNKVIKSKEENSGSIYKPRWAYYEGLDSFLNKVTNCKEKGNRLQLSSRFNTDLETTLSERTSLKRSSTQDDGDSTASSFSDFDSSSSPRQKQDLSDKPSSSGRNSAGQSAEKKKKMDPKLENYLLDIAKERESYTSMLKELKQVKNNGTSAPQSRWTHFGHYIAMSLDSLDPVVATAAATEMQGTIAKYVSERF